MIGYKAFNKDLTCSDMQYEIGKIYEMEEKPKVCEVGYHFCKSIADTYKYHNMCDDTRICKVEALGDIDTEDDVKYCTNKIRIIEEITEEWVRKGNASSSSAGYCNTGDRNTGNRNTGDRNTGDCNTGNWNTGDCNTGDRNTGDCNTGNRNTGNRNTGDWNTGYWNTGNRNTGDWNTGDRNTGYWNTGDRNTGYCNTDTPKVRMFNRDTDMEFDDDRLFRFRAIMNDCPCTYSGYINVDDMSDKEKENHPEYKTIGGYIKTFVVTKKDKQIWWDEEVNDEDKEFIRSLPYFDAAIFEECTGIRVYEERKIPKAIVDKIQQRNELDKEIHEWLKENVDLEGMDTRNADIVDDVSGNKQGTEEREEWCDQRCLGEDWYMGDYYWETEYPGKYLHMEFDI